MKRFTIIQQLLFVFIVGILITGCKRDISKSYGIVQPKIENEASIKKFALKHKLDTSNIVTVGSKDFFPVLSGVAMPNAAIFDSKGEYIEYMAKNANPGCNAGLFKFIPDLSKDSSYNKTGKTTLLKELKRFRTLKGKPIPGTIDAGYDFYVVIYWLKWQGKLNEDHVKAWEDMARQNNKCRIKVIKVNLDIQEYWEANERDDIYKSMTAHK